MQTSSLARKAIKAAALPLGVASRRRLGDLVILLYHRVGAGSREVDIEAAQFEGHLEYLASHQRVPSLDHALHNDGGGVVLTFDDGYADFFTTVLPLLDEYEVPALLYLATGLMGTGTLPSLPSGRALDWHMLRDAVASGWVTVGAHTHTHADLSHADEETAQREMAKSKRLIEDNLEVECRHFAFPWGVRSHAATDVAARLFQTAALGDWRTNRYGRTDPHALGRTPVLRSDGQLLFKARARGLLHSEALVYRALGKGPWGKQ